jgi:chromosomal replication initiator protein
MIEHDRQTWSAMLAYLRAKHPTLCRQWFEEIEPMGIAGGVLRLRAHSAIHRDYLQRQCAEPFREAAQQVTRALLSVLFLGPEDELAPPQRPAAQQGAPGANGTAGHGAAAPEIPAVTPRPAPRAPGVYTDSLVINPDCAFEHFVVGPGNRLAHAAAMAVATTPGRAYNPYFVHGKVGLGKTHLLQAICLRIRETHPNATIYYTSCDGFVNQFFDAVQAGEMAAFRHKFRDVDVLVIDDIHFLAKRDRTQEEFFHTFNSLYQAHKQIVLSSDAPPEDIPDLEERLVSRFKWGLVANVDAPGYETRVAIVKQKARLRGLELPEEAACLIAARIESNIRELEGAVVKLQMIASVEGRAPDLEMTRQALGEEPGRVEKPLQIQVITNVVTDFYGVKITDLQSKRRHRSVALPRQVCMFLARRMTLLSLEQIGGFFGGRDHTTVMHAIRTVEEKCSQDGEFAVTIRSLEERVRASAT